MTKAPALLDADRVSYDEKAKVAVAEGNVEISQGDRLLRADHVTYNMGTGVVTAEGHVAVMEPGGNVVFADHAELTGDMKSGFVNKIRVLLTDNSRFAAQEGERLEGRYIVLRRAVYSPCNLCKADPTRAPIWQMRAARVTHDSVAKRIIYRDAWLDVAGVPVFYTPYFSHPDPSVKRKSGFLPPSLGSNQNLKKFFRPSYYWDIAPDIDATISPTISEEDGFQFAGQYRQRVARGRMQFDGSAVRTDRITDQGTQQKDQWRGHLFGNLRYDLTPTFRTGADVAFTSDKSYLYRYNIPTRDVLVNRGFVEGFRGRNYASADMYYFQDLRPGEKPTEPVVAPNLFLEALGAPGKTLGGRWSLSTSAVALTRDQSIQPVTRRGPDSRRASLEAGWQRALVAGAGFLTTASASVRLDGFWSSRLANPEQPGATFNDAATLRSFPQANVTVRYPFGRQSGAWQQIIEPLAALTTSPKLGDEPRIANEDSIDVEFDHTNLFSRNRFTGVDRLESGTWTTYGLRGAMYADSGARIETILGQSYRLTNPRDFPTESGLNGRKSDYVGKIDLQPFDWAGANYMFRLDTETLEPHRTEINSFLGKPWLRTYANYLSLEQHDLNADNATISEITYGASSRLTRYWSVGAWQRRAFKPESGPRNTGASLTYADECLTVGVTANRDETTRPDLKAGTSVVLTLLLKNLGSVQTDALSTALGRGENRERAHD